LQAAKFSAVGTDVLAVEAASRSAAIRNVMHGTSATDMPVA